VVDGVCSLSPSLYDIISLSLPLYTISSICSLYLKIYVIFLRCNIQPLTVFVPP
jgi:hypothetical protein